MKKWFCFLILLLLLTGCGKQEIPSQPYELEVEYGDSGVLAVKGYQSWSHENGTAEAEAVDPLEMLSDIPFVNETKAKKIKLLFEEKPETLEISYRSSADSYKEETVVEKAKATFEAPTDGASYLYTVHAKWELDEGFGGACTYYFRYLPEHATGEATQEMSLYRLIQMEAADLFGVEFFNNLDGQKKTCTSGEDREAILNYFKAHLSTNFVEIEMPAEEADYVLRMAATQGEQITLSYGGEGQGAWILLDGVPYEAEVMDLYSLWEDLSAEAVSLQEDTNQDYLAVSETAPLAELESPVHLGYLQSLSEDTVIVKTVTWINDENEPNGYRLEEGDLATWTLAADCQYWVLDHHVGPYGQVEQDQLWQWAQSSGYDVLFCLHEGNGELLAIYEQYIP